MIRSPYSIRRAYRLICAFALLISPTLMAQEIAFHFDGADATPVRVRGDVAFGADGPRGPEFEGFDASNEAVRFGGGHLVLHSITDDAFTFNNGDAISIEAWVKVDTPSGNSPMYIIGKGRSGSPEFARDNQNWALRLVGSDGVLNLSFLFATTPGAGDKHWHRWTSTQALYAEAGWHHVAVSYRFGDPSTIRGWIDGKPTDGRWDMGGATKEPPVVDGDSVWIGSALGGNPGSTFKGLLDDVVVRREVITDEQVASVFKYNGPPRMGEPIPVAMPELGQIEPGVISVSITEGLSSHSRWPYMGEAKPEKETLFALDSFILDRLPLHYDDYGIRNGWDAPLLVRLAADVPLREGEQTFLLRARALSRLWVDGQLVASTEPLGGPTRDGEEPMTPVAEPPLPGLRPHGYFIQEVIADAHVESSGGETVRVVFETMVGGGTLRTEIGEATVAVLNDSGDSYSILSAAPERAIPLTDSAVEHVLARQHAEIDNLDDERRRSVAAKHNDYWNQRHEHARAWLASNPSNDESTSIDEFIDSKIEIALASSDEANTDTGRLFHDKVLPILEEACFRCHGEKEKGGLRLNSREAMLEGGKSAFATLVPGDSAASELIARVTTDDEDERMPPTDLPLSADDIAALTAWVDAGAPWPGAPIDAGDVAIAPVIDDYAFVRRVYLDTVGVPPTPESLDEFVASTAPDKRDRLVDSLLNDDRVADNWMGFWQDMLAENPTLINQSLNSTGPFRWFIYDSLRDDKALDRMVTELIMMRGGVHEGGSAGFGLAAENDARFAAKGHILASAFLGVEMQCARCHDSPYHSTTQRDLFSLAAMLDRKPASVPNSSAVPKEFFSKLDRKPLIQVTLEPGEPVSPTWPFADITGASEGEALDELLRNPDDSRERLAALITSPANHRFPRVMVNRVWQRLMGTGIVEPAHDWEGRQASHPELLDWLARELVANDYDLKHVMRLIMTSEAYQREAIGDNAAQSAELRFFNAPDARRLTAEQIVDSLHAASGRAMDVETLTFVHDGRRPLSQRMSLGKPDRAWMFANLANERDRPSLSLPKARSVADVLQAFGWSGARQKPIVARAAEPNVLQPGVLANGTLSASLTRASAGSVLAGLAVQSENPELLAKELFARILSRPPSERELEAAVALIENGFEDRVLPVEEREAIEPLPRLPLVTWFNHLQADANTIQLEWERRVRMGPPADPRLRTEWREAYEDVVWSLVNHPEFVWMP